MCATPSPIPLKVTVGMRSQPSEGRNEVNEGGVSSPHFHYISTEVEADYEDDGKNDGEDAPEVDDYGFQGLWVGGKEGERE